MSGFSYRPYYVEWRGELHFESPFHIGTGERWRIETDMPVAKEGGELRGAPYVPGSSLRGVLRDHLERECGLAGCSKEDVERLFGRVGERKEEAESEISRLRVFDACIAKGRTIKPEVRDHVRIDAVHGAAASGAKFDMEAAVLPPRETLSFGMVYEGEEGDEEAMRLVEAGLRALGEGELRIGAHSGWGYGKVRLERGSLRRAAFLRSTVKGLAEFLDFRGGETSYWQKVDLAAPGGEPKAAGARDAESTLEFRIELRFEGPMLVKAAVQRTPDPEAENPLELLDKPEEYWKAGQYEADHAAVTSNGKVYLPGASLRGVLRAQAARICASQNAASVVGLCFGAEKSAAKGIKGLFEIGSGIPAEPVREVFLDHVAIDRITQMAAATKKFADCALDSPRFETTIRARLPQDRLYAGALLGMLLRDLREGRIWAGSGVTKGYGKIAGMKILWFRGSLVEGALDWGAPQGAERKRGRVEVTRAETEWEDLAWLWKTLDGCWQKIRNRDAS